MTCSETVCTSQIKLDLRVVAPAPGVKSFEIDRPVDEQWVAVDGQWWFVPD